MDHVVPILRERGLFRREYTGRTLREHYGLPRPANTFATAALSSESASSPVGYSPAGSSTASSPAGSSTASSPAGNFGAQRGELLVSDR